MDKPMRESASEKSPARENCHPSLIPDKVWTVAQGGLTDGQPMFFAWGQCERNTGRFYEINFGNQEHRWDHRTVDSRTSRFTNKKLIDQDIAEYGLDSMTRPVLKLDLSAGGA